MIFCKIVLVLEFFHFVQDAYKDKRQETSIYSHVSADKRLEIIVEDKIQEPRDNDQEMCVFVQASRCTDLETCIWNLKIRVNTSH